MSCVIQEVKDLYNLVEHDFFPLDLASKVQPLLTKIAKFGGKLSSASSVPEVQLSQYVPALEKLTTLRLLQQVHCFVSSFFLGIYLPSFVHLIMLVTVLPFCFPGISSVPGNED